MGQWMETENFNRLVGLIYEAALAPALWRDALDELASLLGADTWYLLAWDALHGPDPLGVISDPALSEVICQYSVYCGAIDPRWKLASNSMGAVIACHPHLDERFVSRSAFLQDFFLSLGLRYLMGASLYRSASLEYQIGLQRERGRAPFDADHEALLARLLPHFDRAFRLMEHSQTVARVGEIAAAGIAATPLAVIALDRIGRVMHCNRRGEKLLKEEYVLRFRAGVLTCADGKQASRFIAAVEATMKTGRPANLLLQHTRNPGERYSVTLTSLPKRGAFSLAGEPEGVLCLAAPLDRRRIATARQLMQLFGLSSAEARLTRALAVGESLEDYARENGLRLPTVKTQLRAIFAKTGTDRQAALLRLVIGIPAVRESS